MAFYDHQKIEKKWRKEWAKKKLYGAPDRPKAGQPRAENFYALVEFPYPSGNLHTGHWYAFSVPDIFVRLKRMKGMNVMFPMGFDAFGLPAENAAIKRGLNPKKWTYENIAYMKKQLDSMGASFDWSREVITADPEYYKWTQWIFLQFLKNGLAYQAETAVNWCPKDKTVLANEQVVNGRCDRCGAEVEQRKMKQWMLKITDYAEKLLSGLEKLDWKEEIKEAQRNWIGKSEGALLKFPISNSQFSIDVFTTRPDTLFGATYLVLAPEHEFIEEHKLQITNYKEVKEYIEKAKRKTQLERQKGEKEKTGVELKGIKAINPANGEEIPIWIADYVLSGYGTGAIMAVPAHDERDFEFAEKFRLPVVNVIEPIFGAPQGDEVKKKAVISAVRDPKTDKIIVLNWGPRQSRHGGNMLIGGTMNEGEEIETTARREIAEETGYTDLKLIKKSDVTGHGYFYSNTKNHNVHVDAYGLYFELQSEKKQKTNLDHGEKEKFSVEWHPVSNVADMLHDGIHEYFFRTMVLGEICKKNGVLTNSGKFDGMDSGSAGKAIIEFVGGKKVTQYKLRDWVVSRQRYWGVPIPVIHCSKCGAEPVPDKDLPIKLPDIKDYLPTGEGKSPLAKAEKWVKTKCPSCKGSAERETDTLDTFVDSSWYFLRYIDPKNKKKFAAGEKMKLWMPVDLYSGGAEHTTMHLLYSRFWYKAMFDLGLLGGEAAKLGDEPFKMRKNRGLVLGPDGQKMSKSKGNVIDPDEYVKKLGSDTVRMYLAFLGPYDQVGSYPWDPQGILGIRRFLDRVWKMGASSSKFSVLAPSVSLEDAIILIKHFHKTIKKVGEDIENFRFNTAISALMILLNEMEKSQVSRENFETFIKLLAPFAPHMTEELWHKLGDKSAQGRPALGWKSIHLESWPEFDPKQLEEDFFELIVQINGKLRDTFRISRGISQAEAEKLTLAREKVKLALENKKPRKIIYVPGRLINFVV
ncbi:leucine--tRNA ligase [Candidatus Giovannonibacteria bacterium]|nr:leucine--tRNA ligase [Candidatus Giovannonibacteria bacterium]